MTDDDRVRRRRSVNPDWDAYYNPNPDQQRELVSMLRSQATSGDGKINPAMVLRVLDVLEDYLDRRDGRVDARIDFMFERYFALKWHNKKLSKANRLKKEQLCEIIAKEFGEPCELVFNRIGHRAHKTKRDAAKLKVENALSNPENFPDLIRGDPFQILLRQYPIPSPK